MLTNNVDVKEDESDEGNDTVVLFDKPHNYHRISDVTATFQTLSQRLTLRLAEQEVEDKMISAKAGIKLIPTNQLEDLSSGLSSSTTKVHDLYTIIDLPHMIHIEQLCKILTTDAERGLSQDWFNQLIIKYGVNPNTLKPPTTTSSLLLLAKLSISGFNFVLWIAALLCFLAWKPIGSPPDPQNLALAIVISFVVLINTSFNFYQEKKATNIIASFRNIIPQQAHVIRNNKNQTILATQLQYGDLVQLKIGEKVPADIRLVKCNGLQVNNSALTGESVPVKCSIRCTSKNFMESANYLFYGCDIVSGSGSGIVCAIGDGTILGQIAKLTRGPILSRRKSNYFIVRLLLNAGDFLFASTSEVTHLHKEINRFVWFIVVMAILTACVAWIGYEAFLKVKHENFMPIAAMITNCVGLVVAYIPEGLPLTVTLTLTFVAQRMYTKNVLVKNLATVATFNSVNTICTDKTGTLTTGKVTVCALYSGSHLQTIFQLPLLKDLNSELVLKELLLGSIICNDGKIEADNESIEGDAADVALLKFVLRLQSVESIQTILQQNSRIHSIPFNSKLKIMIVQARISNRIVEIEDQNQSWIWMKGAPEVVLKCCSFYYDDNFNVIPITVDFENMVMKRQECLGFDGYRILALARQYSNIDYPLSNNSNPYQDHTSGFESFPQTNYIFMGLVALSDPPREGVKKAVELARRAGIRVSMVTGDHSSTAVSIAKRTSIISAGHPDMYSCKLGEDNLHRAVFQILQNDKVQQIHAIGSKSSEMIITNESGKNSDQVSQRNIPPVLCHTYGAMNILPHCVVVTGNELGFFDEWMWDWLLAHEEIVFSRTTPAQKLKIVQEFQRRNEVVAVTGDGVNDAPALKSSNIGVAMQSGSEVARDSADLVVLDNNFVSIVSAIETGRLVSENLKKICLYLLPAGSWSEMIPVMANIFIGIPLPLSTFLMIVICMVTDVFASLALVQEMSEADLMSRNPAKPNTPDAMLVDSKLLSYAFLIIGTLETVAAFTCFFWWFRDNGLGFYDLWEAYENYSDGYLGFTQDQLNELLFTGQSIFFVALVIVQFFNVLAVRTRKVSILSQNPFWGLKRNLYLLLAMVGSTLAAIIVTQVQFFQNTYYTRPVPVRYVVPAIGFGAFLLLFDECRKFVVRNYPSSVIAQFAW